MPRGVQYPPLLMSAGGKRVLRLRAELKSERCLIDRATGPVQCEALHAPAGERARDGGSKDDAQSRFCDAMSMAVCQPARQASVDYVEASPA